MLSELSDDCRCLVEDSYNEEFKELRKELKSEMQNLSRSERESLLKDMLESGALDERQYQFLYAEFR
jgi:hypothetical protein